MKKENEVTMFNNSEFGGVRTVVVDGKVLFVGRDIASALGYSNPSKAVSTHCKNAVKAVVNVSSQNGKSDSKARDTQEMYVIQKGDIYRLIVSSKLPSAEKFESWVFDEVLPSIEENGGYIRDNASSEQVEKLVECYTFKSITKQILECDIMGLEKLIDDILGTNTSSKKANRDKYHLDLSGADYKVKLHEHIKKAIDSRPMIADASCAVEIAMRYKLSDKLSKEALSTTRRSTSHIAAHKDKKIKELTTDNSDKLIWLDYAPFSINYMYTDKHKISDVYKKWMDKFPYDKLEDRETFEKRVDSNKPMRLIVEIVAKEGQDTDNSIKSLQDRLQDYYRFDDVNIKNVNIKNVGNVKKYSDCKIGYYLENIKETKKK